MAETVPVGQINYKISVIVMEDGSAVDISGASVKQIRVKNPAGEITLENASFETTGTDGEMYYRIPEITLAGWWKFRGYVEIGSFKGYTKEGSFLAEAL